MTNKIICCGLLVADLKFNTQAFPKRDEKVFANAFNLLPGGPATNAAITIQQLGSQAQLLATSGSCSLSDSILKMVSDTGVNIDKVLHVDDALNVSAVLAETSGERRVISYKQKTEYHTPKHLEAPTAILLDGHQVDVSLQLMQRFPDVPTILDAGSVHEGTELLFDKVDWLITSKKYALTKTDSQDLDSALQKLSRLNPKTVITNGEHGCLYSINGSTGKIPGLSIECIDSNGAGDVFHGAFAHALSQQRPHLECLAFANEIAAKSCQRVGIIGPAL